MNTIKQVDTQTKLSNNTKKCTKLMTSMTITSVFFFSLYERLTSCLFVTNNNNNNRS